jgi:signal transduction histidine kinase
MTRVHETSPQPALFRAHSRLVARRLPLFIGTWLGAVTVWEAVLAMQDRLGPVAAAVTLLAQGAVGLVAIRLVRAVAPTGVLPLLVATAIVLGWSITAVFAAVGGGGDVLAFLLLLLYLASALFFVWGVFAGLAVLVPTVAAWAAAAPWLRFEVDPLELGTAILLGAAISLATAEVGRRAVVAALAHRIGELRARRALAAALDRERRARSDAEESRLRAETAGRARDELVAMVSHELRSPLHAVTTWTRLLRQGRLEQPRVGRILAAIEENCRLQSRLVEDLVDTARLVSGRLPLRPETLDVRDVVERTAEQVRPEANAKGVALVTRVGQKPATLRADPLRLHQIVENLLSNAVRYTRADDEITAEVRPTAGGVEIVVRDTGAGIAPEMLAVVFEPFTSGESQSGERLGMGLAIVRRLVELHGGTIRAESGGPRHGATFRVWLPGPETAEAARPA